MSGIFFDIDGTLLSHASGGVPESARRALTLLEERGVPRFLATGRHILEIRRLLPGLSFDGFVTLNGQICLRRNCPIPNILPPLLGRMSTAWSFHRLILQPGSWRSAASASTPSSQEPGRHGDCHAAPVYCHYYQ